MSKLKRGSKAAALLITIKKWCNGHTVTYEFNNAFREQFEAAGFVFSGESPETIVV